MDDGNNQSGLVCLRPQAQETAEALDAAAVEAALSLCEENGHALSTAWDAGPFQPHDSSHAAAGPPALPHPLQGGLQGKTQVLQVQCGAIAGLPSLCSAQDNCLPTFPAGLDGLPPDSATSCASRALELRYVGAPPLPEAVADVGDFVQQKSQMSLDVGVKCGSKKWAQLRAESNHRGTRDARPEAPGSSDLHALFIWNSDVSSCCFLSLLRWQARCSTTARQRLKIIQRYDDRRRTLLSKQLN